MKTFQSGSGSLFFVLPLLLIFILSGQSYSQQKRFSDLPPKQQIEYLERMLKSTELTINNSQSSIQSKQREIERAQNNIKNKQNSFSRARSEEDRKDIRNDIQNENQRIQNANRDIIDYQNKISNGQLEMQKIQAKILEIKSATAAKMNEKKIELSLKEQNAGEKEDVDQESEYTHGRLSIPESKLTPQALILQRNELGLR